MATKWVADDTITLIFDIWKLSRKLDRLMDLNVLKKVYDVSSSVVDAINGIDLHLIWIDSQTPSKGPKVVAYHQYYWHNIVGQARE